MKGIVVGLSFCLSVGVALGDGDALFREGAALFGSEPARAFPLFVQAAEKGHVQAMVGAGHCLENGIGTKLDYAEAIAWYDKAMEQNDLKACEGLARIYASAFDPRLHDGEKALKYTGALVRQNPRDPDTLCLLAAAFARNADFERALSTIKKVLSRETRAVEIAQLEKLQERYQNGMPTPALATEEWILDAANHGSMWAMEHAVRKMSDPSDPLYEPETALILCRKGIQAGADSLYAPLIDLYLDAGDVDQAYNAYRQVQEATRGRRWSGLASVEIRFGRMMQGKPDHLLNEAEKYTQPRTSITVSGKYDEIRLNSQDRYVVENGDMDYHQSFETEDALKSAFPSWSPGQSEITGQVGDRRYRLQVRVSKSPPDMQASLFLLRIAAAKGNSEARRKRDALVEEMNRYRTVLESVAGEQNGPEVASALSAEALKFCDNEELPANLPLVEELLLKSYEIDPSPRMACMLGMFYLRDYFNYQYVKSRSPEMAEHWLTVAHNTGYDPATRRLIELYACDEDPTIENADQAIKYAEALVEQHPRDYDALQLLACAYAANRQFMDAKMKMAEAVELCPQTDNRLRYEYDRKVAGFNKGEVWTIKRISTAYNRETFPEWVQALPD